MVRLHLNVRQQNRRADVGVAATECWIPEVLALSDRFAHQAVIEMLTGAVSLGALGAWRLIAWGASRNGACLLRTVAGRQRFRNSN